MYVVGSTDKRGNNSVTFRNSAIIFKNVLNGYYFRDKTFQRVLVLIKND